MQMAASVESNRSEMGAGTIIPDRLLPVFMKGTKWDKSVIRRLNLYGRHFRKVDVRGLWKFDPGRANTDQ
jgi:hypothetical protein